MDKYGLIDVAQPKVQAVRAAAILATTRYTKTQLDVHGSLHHNSNLIEITNRMQLCRTIYYSIVP